jgi:teichuronic acid biosynthesis glycosyltransferase TuaG
MYEEALKNTTIFTSTVMFDMRKLTKDDIYFPNVESEDTANWWKILRLHGKAYGLDEALTLYRRSVGTLSSNKFKAVGRTWRLYRRTERLPLIKSLCCFTCYIARAVKRRL